MTAECRHWVMDGVQTDIAYEAVIGIGVLVRRIGSDPWSGVAIVGGRSSRHGVKMSQFHTLYIHWIMRSERTIDTWDEEPRITAYLVSFVSLLHRVIRRTLLNSLLRCSTHFFAAQLTSSLLNSLLLCSTHFLSAQLTSSLLNSILAYSFIPSLLIYP